MTLFLTVLLLTLLFVCYCWANEEAAVDTDDFIEEEEMDEATDLEFDQADMAAAQQAAMPEPIDWDTVPDGPAPSFEVLEVPENCVKAAADGDFVELHYTGTLEANGEKFDSSYEHDKPLQLILGERKRTIRGFDVGLQGICAGERRLIKIPPAWGYGSKELGPIPADSTLLFEVEALSVGTPPTISEEAVAANEGSWTDLLIAVAIFGSCGAAYHLYNQKYQAAKKKKSKKGPTTPKVVKKFAAQLKKQQ